MKKILLLLTLLISISGLAQGTKFKKPDYKKIEKAISDDQSSFYYPRLMEKYLRADSMMTLEEKRHLYYGFSFQENYAPYGQSSFNDSLRDILAKEELSELDYSRIITFTDSLLISNPFDLRAINYQLYANEKLGNETAFNIRITQMKTIFDALVSSGNGLKKSTAYYVIFTSHEYALLDILGFEFGGQQSLVEHYDHLTLADNPANIKGLYFDVSTCLNSLTKAFKK